MERDEPEELDIVDDLDAAEAQRQDDAFQRLYENDHTWESLQEDEQGMLRVDRTSELRARRMRALAASAPQARVRKGMIRYMLLVMDLSNAAVAQDLKPSRLTCMVHAAQEFVRSFFDQNPLSQLGILVMRGGVCIRLTELSASPESQLRRLELAALAAEGAASLANALDMGVALLRHIPPYGHREMLIMFAALSTCDPGNIFTSVKAAKAANIRVSVVGIAAEVHVCRHMTEATGGTYGVALHGAHLSELLAAHAPPPPLKAGHAGSELVAMGFPQRGSDSASSAVFVGAEARLLAGSYSCPRCKARVAELPSECHVCNLTLISSPHLARSYHHLFPVPPYQELSKQQIEAVSDLLQQSDGMNVDQNELQVEGLKLGSELPGTGLYCFGCLRDLGANLTANKAGRAGESMVLCCVACKHVFCLDCDMYVHDSLHNCPGCELARS